jgi:adenylate kinase
MNTEYAELTYSDRREGRRALAPVIVLMGPPGAGKGTQAQFVSAHLSVPKISTGDIFRANVSQGTRAIAMTDTPLGREVREIQKSGGLVGDAVMARLLLNRTTEPDCRNGYILDGFPRTIAQAELLESLNDEDRRPLALSIVVPTQALMRRLTGRWTCPVCGTIYNVYTSPPKVAGVCDRDGAALVHRSDDTEQAVEVRLSEYRRETAPLTAFYESRGRLLKIDGDRDPEMIFRDLAATLEVLL